jgi:hypothetical protein
VNRSPVILILAQEAGGIPNALERGFQKCGESAELYVYNENLCAKGIFDRITHRLCDPGYQKDIMTLFNNTLHGLKNKILSDAYQAIIIMRGNYLDKDNENLLSAAKIPVIQWTYDSLCRAPMQRDVMKLADYVFYVDKEDTKETEKGKSEWLPLGYDDQVYIPSEKKDIDVFMSGSIGPLYTKRKKFLEILGCSQTADNYNCAFIGSTGFRLSDSFVRAGKVEWIEKMVSPEVLAHYQARAKVCINIHQDDGKFSVNPSFFSIPGSRSCQLAENKQHLAEFLVPSKEFQEFDGDGDFIEKLQMLLENEENREKVSYQGFLKVKNHHTMVSRAKRIIEIIKQESLRFTMR